MSAAASGTARGIAPALRLLPLLLLAAAIVAALFFKPQSFLTLDELAAHRAWLLAWVARHYAASLVVFAVVYFATKLIFVPTGPFLAAAGGFLLGIWPAAAVASLAGLLAATAVFVAVDQGLGRHLRNRALPFVDRMALGFRRHGWSYLLAMRLLPVMRPRIWIKLMMEIRVVNHVNITDMQYATADTESYVIRKLEIDPGERLQCQ